MKPRGKAFGPDNPPPGKGRQPGRSVKQTSAYLADLRHVYRQPVETDKTEGHRMCRKFKDDDPKGFLKEIGLQERAHAAGKREVHAAANLLEGSDSSASEPEEVDEGEVRALDLIDRILGEWEAQKAAPLHQ